MDRDLVTRVKQSVQGKKYSELTKEEWDVLFGDDANTIDCACRHNKIVNDSGTASETYPTASIPKFFEPEPVADPEPVIESPIDF